jgi:hypothetical protein
MKGEKGTAAQSFEDLHVLQRARELTNGVYQLTRKGDFARDCGLSDQIRRAAVSVMSNIAEGFERGTKTEFIQFLYIAKGAKIHDRCSRPVTPFSPFSPSHPSHGSRRHAPDNHLIVPHHSDARVRVE